jgi:hypothetical protein
MNSWCNGTDRTWMLTIDFIPRKRHPTQIHIKHYFSDLMALHASLLHRVRCTVQIRRSLSRRCPCDTLEKPTRDCSDIRCCSRCLLYYGLSRSCGIFKWTFHSASKFQLRCRSLDRDWSGLDLTDRMTNEWTNKPTDQPTNQPNN